MFGEEEDEISEDIQEGSDLSSDEKRDHLVESAGTSHGPDQSVNSLAFDEFDYVEAVRKT
jgi:fructose/tagatose bisphosphate aldolase